MVARITLEYNRYETAIDPIDKINDILRSSYDYQHANMEYSDTSYPDGRTEHTFTFYLQECDQPKRTVETLRKIEDLLTSYI